MEEGSQKGYVLPFVLLISALILSVLTIWYRQTIVTGYLAEQLIHQRAQSVETESLIPALIIKLDSMDEKLLLSRETNFLEVSYKQKTRWIIDRSEHKFEKIQFTFHPVDTNNSSIVLTIPYKR